MLFDKEEENPGGGNEGPFCTRCSQPIAEGETMERLKFEQDPHGHRGLSGPYHSACAKPFLSFERILNFNPWGRF
jgi:hypothetical protein